MNPITTKLDSTIYQDTTETVSVNEDTSHGTSGKESFPYVVFGVPILLTIIVTWLKYNIGRSIKPRDLSKAFLDLCIDSLTVGATILFAYYNLINAPSSIFWLGTSLAIVMFYCLHIRMMNKKGEIPESLLGYCLLFGSILFSTGILAWLFFKVC